MSKERNEITYSEEVKSLFYQGTLENKNISLIKLLILRLL